MTIWLDNHLPPALAQWLSVTFNVECLPVRDLDLQRAPDLDIFRAANNPGSVVMTKDADFAALVSQYGPPPQIVLVTCGNTSNARLRALLEATWPTVVAMLQQGEPLVELGEQPS